MRIVDMKHITRTGCVDYTPQNGTRTKGICLLSRKYWGCCTSSRVGMGMTTSVPLLCDIHNPVLT